MTGAAGWLDLELSSNRAYVMGLGRLSAGAILFSLPILATMEMWRYGFYLDPLRMLQFLAVCFTVLVALSRVSGFRTSGHWVEDVMDTFAAFGIAALWASFMLWLFGVITPSMPLREVVGDIAIEAIPASFGAMLANKFLKTGRANKKESKRASYVGQMVIMLGGALFFGFDVGPTEEMILISFRMGPVHAILLMIVSLFLLHIFIYTVGFTGEAKPPGPTSFWSIFIRFTLPGYALVALTGLYLLWTFGRVQGSSPADVAAMVAVIAFPASIGASLARTLV